MSADATHSSIPCRAIRWCRAAAIALIACLLMCSISGAAAAKEHIDLAGDWQLRLDPHDVGVQEQWFQRPLPDAIRLPGSLQEQGFGHEVSVDTNWTGTISDRSWFTSPRYSRYRQAGGIKVPFWLQPQKHYVGPAWYGRGVRIPPSWREKRILLLLERCHWETTVWLDGKQLASADSLSTAHRYDLTNRLQPGNHRLLVRVDNRLKVNVGPNSHSVTDHTQTNWNGIIGRLELQATDRLWIDNVQIYPDVVGRSARVQITVGNATGHPAHSALTVDAMAVNVDLPHDPPAKRMTVALDQQNTVELEYLMGEGVQLWDEFHPALYRLTVQLEANADQQSYRDETTVTFGMRSIATQGRQFLINGRPLFLRGTLDCCVFPHTGYPPTEVAAWKRILRICKMHGLNHMRFHSWCPPEAAFLAADELGFYFQVECGSWANQGASIGEGRPLDRWLYAETDRILRQYGNHPSFLLMAYGNEPAGPGRGATFLGPWLGHCRTRDPRRLYTSAAGWPLIPESQYHNTPGPRIHQWGAGLGSRINAHPPETVTDYRQFIRQYQVPVVSHEIGQWCVYPNFEEMAKYKGLLQPKNFEIFRDFLEANQMGDQARQFLMASGRLQVICYKEEIESALRTPGLGGFQLLDLHDFPGQGTALVGVLDPFWDSKPYVTPQQFRRFCNQTVPLARLTKRVFTNRESLAARLEVFHFGPADLNEAVVYWKLITDDGRPVAFGATPAATIPAGRLSSTASIDVPLQRLGRAQRLRLVVGIQGTPFENDWDVWVYPERMKTTESDQLLLVDHLGQQAIARLQQGGKVLLLLPPQAVRGDVVIGFSPVFWNTLWTQGQPPHTLGILCDPQHPALADFPTQYHTNWQWWELISRSAAMVLDELPRHLRPLIQPIDTWFEARRLGLVFEAKVAGGKLLVCSIDLEHDLDKRPAARQLRHSLLKYMAGGQFEPQVELKADVIRRLARAPSRMERLGAKVTADSQMDAHPPSSATDGNPKTIWHTAWGHQEPPFPHQLLIDLNKPMRVTGLSYLPRQDMSNGRIARFAVYVSTDGQSWGEPVAAGTWPDSRQQQRVRLAAPRQVRYVKLVAQSEVNGNSWASAAEVEVTIE